MRIDSRLIGFTAHREACLFQSSLGRYVRSAVHPIRLKIGLILPRATPLQSAFVRRSSPIILRCQLHLSLGFVPSSRHHSCAATFFRGASQAPLRSVLRLSQPHDGFFRARARRLISSRCHVQGPLSFRGLLSRRSHPSSSEGAFLHAVAASPLVPTVRLSPARLSVHVRRFSASRPLSAPGRVPLVRLFTSPRAAPLFEFHAPPGYRSLDVGLRSRSCLPLMMLRVRCSTIASHLAMIGVRVHLRGTGYYVSPGQFVGRPPCSTLASRS